MNTELQLLETVSLPFEAEHLQQVLESAGIEAYVEGVNGSNAFGMNALMGSIKIKVRTEDLPQARQVLSDSFNRVGRPWYCGNCQEMNEPSFDYCWQCEGERAAVETEIPAPPETPAVEVRPEDLLSPHPMRSEYNPAPYAPPTTDLALPAPGKNVNEIADSPTQAEYEETIERAYRASIIGLITLPVLLHIYSFVLLMGALSLPATTTAQITWRFRCAMSINLIVFAALGWFLSWVGTY